MNNECQEERIRKFGNGLCHGCNGCQEKGRKKREEGRRKKGNAIKAMVSVVKNVAWDRARLLLLPSSFG
ncbi:hypothetical protein [Microcoleus sp. herbarium5]|uniref:hypothetical protein n=1 Tax=Microcoleus sp. herbarium5 TaxID=3055434 RepID=UPI002FD5BB0E